MKPIPFLLLSFFFAGSLQAQDLKTSYLSEKLVPGYPAEVSLMVEGLTALKSATLETGIDSFQVYFGSSGKGEGKLFWASLYNTTQRRNQVFSRFALQESDTSGMLAGELEFLLNNASRKVSGKVFFNPASEEVFYQWENKEGRSKIASINKVERAIQPNEPMPYFKVEALNGAAVSLDDFKGKYLVINWWATSCAPCLTEMPGLNELAEKYASRDDVSFLAIANDDKERLKKFLTKRGFRYQQTVANTEVATMYGKSYPKHLIVNPQGAVTYYLEGGNAEIHLDIEQSLISQLENK